MRYLAIVSACFLINALSGGASAQTDAPLYINAQYFVGDMPRDLQTVDLNGDGRLDLLTANVLSGDVSVLISNGQGGFKDEQRYSALPGARSFDLGDLNLDGRTDLAVACSDVHAVAVLLGDGQGGFGAPNAHAVGTAPYGVRLCDFDRDGDLDLATADSGDNAVSVCLGDGQGGFGPPASHPVGTEPRSLGVGDFNADGWLDIAAANYGNFVSGVSVLLGNQAGSFGAATTYSAGNDLRSLKVGDLSADGILDLAVLANYSMVVLRGDGHGGFHNPTAYGLFPNEAGVGIGDLNGDGFNDLIGAIGSLTILRIRWGHASGNLQPGPTVEVAGQEESIVVGDFNQDGIGDVATAGPFTDNVTVLLRNAQGVFPVAPRYLVDLGPQNIATGDFNGDSFPDFALPRWYGDDVRVLLGNGNGGITPFVGSVNAVGTDPAGIALGDLDQNGTLDIVATNVNSQSVSILRGLGNGAFQSAVNMPVGAFGSRAVTVASLNADTWPDLAIANADSNNVAVFLGSGQGNFGAPSHYPTGMYPRAIAAGDFNGDGNSDLATADWYSDRVTILAGDGQGAFLISDTLLIPPLPICVTTADLNSDGRDDLLAISLGALGADAVLSAFVQTAQGTMHHTASYPSGISSSHIAVGDLDGDGAVDAATANDSSHNVTVFLGDGQGGFPGRMAYVNPAIGSCASDPQHFVVCDMDSDNKLDIVTSNACNNTILVMLNQLTAAPGTPMCSAHAVIGDCPCGNSGATGHGCDNSASTGGALLESTGSANLASDTLVLTSSGQLPSTLTVFLQGSAYLDHASFGDGLRCIGGALRRLYTLHASGGTASVPGIGQASVSARSAAVGDSLSVGSVRAYQAYYRDPDLSYCPYPTGSSFNVSSGQQVVWQP